MVTQYLTIAFHPRPSTRTSHPFYQVNTPLYPYKQKGYLLLAPALYKAYLSLPFSDAAPPI